LSTGNFSRVHQKKIYASLKLRVPIIFLSGQNENIAISVRQKYPVILESINLSFYSHSSRFHQTKKKRTRIKKSPQKIAQEIAHKNAKSPFFLKESGNVFLLIYNKS